MKCCLACNDYFSSSIRICPYCNADVTILGGYDSYAPALAKNGDGGFDSNYFEQLAKLEKANFWFQYRNKMILWALEKYIPNFDSLLEVGCGTGYVLSGISKKFPSATLFGSEIFVEGLNFAQSRLSQVKLMQMDARKIPFKEEFAVIGAFDVLEHIEQDDCVLTQMYQSLKSKGFIILTVPQHDWLWTRFDEYACHVRRYSALDLHRKVCAAGFKIIRSTSFITSLLPAMKLSRFFGQKKDINHFDVMAELKVKPFLNTIFSQILKVEFLLIRGGINMPVGGSRLVVAQKL